MASGFINDLSYKSSDGLTFNSIITDDYKVNLEPKDFPTISNFEPTKNDIQDGYIIIGSQKYNEINPLQVAVGLIIFEIPNSINALEGQVVLYGQKSIPPISFALK